jgi:hypothetical protein
MHSRRSSKPEMIAALCAAAGAIAVIAARVVLTTVRAS